MALLDSRTREGRFAKVVREELISHLGGQPTAPQVLLIETATLMALRVALLSRHVLSEEALRERDDRQLVAWMNSLRLTLVALGIERPIQAAPSLASYIEARSV